MPPHQTPMSANDSTVESTPFRSEDMTLVQLYIPTELAHATVSELGELGLVQFRDLNPDVNAFQRTFVNEIRRMDELERKLRFLAGLCEKSNITVKAIHPSNGYARSRSVQEIDDLEGRLAELERRMVQMNASYETMNTRYLELTEMKYVLRETAFIFDEAESRGEQNLGGPQLFDDEESLLAAANIEPEAAISPRGVNVSYDVCFVAGVVASTRIHTFEKILWRVLRGNLFMKYYMIDEPIRDPHTDELVKKTVFVVFAHGQQILDKVRRICESLGATIYPVDPSPAKRSEHQLEVAARIEDLNNVLYNTQATRRAELAKIAEVMDQWMVMVRKEKATLHTMNLFNYDGTRKCLIAEGWCPTNAITTIQYALHGASERSGSMIPPVLNTLKTTAEPPTYHKTNRFTKAFQTLIDAYGMAKYKEVNPGLFTVTTFPFLFAMMFGDFGQGGMMFLIGAYMVWNERRMMSKPLAEMLKMLFAGRYIVMMMGVFSIYVGLIYDDIFSFSVNMSPSGWAFKSGTNETETVFVSTYPFGLDPLWHGSNNVLLFINSYKMKQAIVIGVIHMVFGITLTVFNSKFFHQELNIYTEFIPQMIFMCGLFGYLAFLIIFKWLCNWSDRTPPGILNTLIFMFLKPGTVAPEDEFYAGQGTVQAILVLLALISIPWMLISKPYLLYKAHKKTVAAGYGEVGNDSPVGEVLHTPEENHGGGGGGGGGHGHGEKFDMGEIVIHQVIHTIEFCLGGISNTASYLRLWALSLAHAQLSEVLWDMTLANTLTMGFIGIVIGFAMWFTLTVSILLAMEGLSAFLHALRLHWVEFNGKFYAGTGYAFEPFSFARLLEEE